MRKITMTVHKDEPSEDDNIIHHPEGIAIMNGGNPLSGCPKDWDEAELIEKKLNINEGKEETDGPIWKFDCGFKLDFDGPLINVSSRFYPPKSHYGPTWDGTVAVMFLGETLIEKEFDCPTLDELKKQVEDYTKSITDKLMPVFKKLLEEVK